MTENFRPLDEQIESANSVISFTSNSVAIKTSEVLKASNNFLHSQGIKGIHSNLVNQGQGQIPLNPHNWTGEGISCEILSPNSPTWKKGKVRMKVVLEFCPDEPENEEIENPDPDSLDDIRKTL